jgi:hypothetical protein
MGHKIGRPISVFPFLIHQSKVWRCYSLLAFDSTSLIIVALGLIIFKTHRYTILVECKTVKEAPGRRIVWCESLERRTHDVRLRTSKQQCRNNSRMQVRKGSTWRKNGVASLECTHDVRWTSYKQCRRNNVFASNSSCYESTTAIEKSTVFVVWKIAFSLVVVVIVITVLLYKSRVENVVVQTGSWKE